MGGRNEKRPKGKDFDRNMEVSTFNSTLLFQHKSLLRLSLRSYSKSTFCKLGSKTHNKLTKKKKYEEILS
jgi:hypothetical protein